MSCYPVIALLEMEFVYNMYNWLCESTSHRLPIIRHLARLLRKIERTSPTSGSKPYLAGKPTVVCLRILSRTGRVRSHNAEHSTCPHVP